MDAILRRQIEQLSPDGQPLGAWDWDPDSRTLFTAVALQVDDGMEVELDVQFHPVGQRCGQERGRGRGRARERIGRRVMRERAAVLDAQRRQHAAVEAPEGDVEVVAEFGLSGGFPLGAFHAERDDGHPAQPGEDEGGDQEEHHRPADRTEQAP